MKSILIATTNPGKIRELQALLDPLGYRVEALDDAKQRVGTDPPQVDENGETFLDNAILKAQAYARWADIPTVADDSGLCVDALNGAPGIYSARFSGEHASDDDNNQHLLTQLQAHAKPWTAYFCCALAYVDPIADMVWTTEGRVSGNITDTLSGAAGFGYDPLFIPDGYRHTFAQLGKDVKNTISHRAVAFRSLSKMLMDRRQTT